MNYRMMVRGFFTRERKGGVGSAFAWLRLCLWARRLKTVGPVYSLAA